MQALLKGSHFSGEGLLRGRHALVAFADAAEAVRGEQLDVAVKT